MDEVLKRWLRSERVEAFPRRVGLYQEIMDEVAFEGYVERCKERKEEAHAAIFSEKQRKERLFDTILLDIDCQVVIDGQKVMTGEPKKVMEHVVDKLKCLGLTARVIYTGHRYHVWIDFEPVVFDDYTEAVKAWLRDNFEEEINKNWIDYVLAGVEEHLARLPFSWNEKGQDWARELLAGEVNYGFGGELKKYDVKRQDEKKLIVNMQKVLKTYPPCIQATQNSMKKEGDLETAGWFLLGTFYVMAKRPDEAYEFFKKYAKTFDERTASYQLEYLMKKDYFVPSCRWIGDNGLCPYLKMGKSQKECKFYPWIVLAWSDNK